MDGSSSHRSGRPSFLRKERPSWHDCRLARYGETHEKRRADGAAVVHRAERTSMGAYENEGIHRKFAQIAQKTTTRTLQTETGMGTSRTRSRRTTMETALEIFPNLVASRKIWRSDRLDFVVGTVWRDRLDFVAESIIAETGTGTARRTRSTRTTMEIFPNLVACKKI